MNATLTQDSVVNVTESAAREISHLITDKPENKGKHLRIFAEEGGCSGMQYGMVFDEVRDVDLKSEMHGVKVLVDEISSVHLKGSTIDFSDTLTGGGFKIINPNAKQSCGCGKSFEA